LPLWIDRLALRQRDDSGQPRRNPPPVPAAADELDLPVGRRDQPIGAPAALRALDQFLRLAAVAEGFRTDIRLIRYSQ
jgi:hypothetical protein